MDGISLPPAKDPDLPPAVTSTDSMGIEVSAIVCTFDRPKFVCKAIDSLVNQSLDASKYEIVIVDNGTTDDTERAISSTAFRHPDLRYIRLRESGLSNARNAGISHSRGEIFAFLDDDAIACTEWLRSIVAAFREVNPCPGLVCGPVEPDWGAPRPAWLEDGLLGAYSVLDWSPIPRALSPAEWVVGANFAVRRDVMQACGPFDTRVGRKGQSLLSGEETLLTNRIRSAGHPIYYDPAISVKHYIHGERLKKRWLYRRLFWGAASRGIFDRDSSSGFVDSSVYVYKAAKRIGREIFRSYPQATAAERRFHRIRTIVRDLGLLHGYLFIRENTN